MESNNTQTQEQILQEILINTRKTKNYIKWQLILTIIIIVLPIIGSALIIPFILQGFTALYQG